MRNSNEFSNKAFQAFFITLILLLPVNFVASLLFYNELRFPLLTDLLVAALAALISYLRSLSRHIATLEERIEKLEWKLNSKR